LCADGAAATGKMFRGGGVSDRRVLRYRRRGPGASTPAAGCPIRARGQGLRGGLRLRRRPGARGRRPGGRGRRQNGALRGPAGRGRLRAVRVRVGPVRVRGRVVPAGRTTAQVQPGFPAGAHGRAESDGR